VGKATSVAQLLYVLAVLVEMIVPVPSTMFAPGLAVMLALTMVSGLHYVFRGIRLLSGDGGA
jgi:flagellar biosynthesis component FlhA